MAVVVGVVGWEDFIEFGRKLKKAGNGQLQREVNQGIVRAVRPLQAKVRASARETLPRRGGLAATISRSSMRTQRRASGIRFTTTHRHDIRAMDRGRLRHPLFGNRERWYSQAVEPGWWSDPINASGQRVRAEIEVALINIRNQVES